MSKVNIHFKLHFEKSWPYFVYVGSKHYKLFLFNIFCLLFDVLWVYKNWMIKSDKPLLVLDDGRKFVSYIKNPKYINEDCKYFSIPK